MSCYENLVMKTQMNYSRHYSTYASGGTAVVLSKQKPLPYEEQITGRSKLYAFVARQQHI